MNEGKRALSRNGAHAGLAGDGEHPIGVAEAPIEIEDWVRQDAGAPDAGQPAASPPSGRSGRQRRPITRTSLGTYANDLDAAAAFLGRNRKSLEGYLSDGIATKFGGVIDGWDFRRTFPIDAPFPAEVIGPEAHEALLALRAGNPQVAGPIAHYALDTSLSNYRSGRANAHTALQRMFLRVVQALSWATNRHCVSCISNHPQGMPTLYELHWEIAQVIEREQMQAGSAEHEPWLYLRELSAGFALCYELLKIVARRFLPEGEDEGGPPLTRSEQRLACQRAVAQYMHLQHAAPVRLHASSRLHWNMVQLAAIANRTGYIDLHDRRGDAQQVLKARSAFVSGIDRLKQNYGVHFPAIERYLLIDEQTGPMLRQLYSGGLNR